MNKFSFKIGQLTFYYIIDKQHIDVFVAGVSNANIKGIMTLQELKDVSKGLQRIKQEIPLYIPLEKEKL